MTARVLARSQLPQLVSSLVAGRHLVMLVPATDDVAWAADTAWAFARAAAAGARRVLLVDLSLEEPALDRGAATRLPRGIVDAFAADASLSDVAREQDPSGLHYIGRGTPTPDPQAVWASGRWERLARGFAQEGALLILYAPSAALGALRADSDGLVVLAPDGYDPEGGHHRELTRRLAGGAAPLAVVVASEGVGASAPPATAPALRPPVHRPLRAARPRRGHPGLYGMLWVIGLSALAGGALLWTRGADPRRAARPQTLGLPASPPLPVPVEATGDSLYYSVQVAAHNTLAQAMEHARRLEQAHQVAIVTPVRLGNQGLWYRVLVGAYPSARVADSALEALWRSGLVERPQGTILRTPEAYRIRAAGARSRAEEQVRVLRERGIPAYIVRAPDGTALVYVGAFDLPDQARTADSLLAAAGLAGTLVQRMGITP